MSKYKKNIRQQTPDAEVTIVKQFNNSFPVECDVGTNEPPLNNEFIEHEFSRNNPFSKAINTLEYKEVGFCCVIVHWINNSGTYATIHYSNMINYDAAVKIPDDHLCVYQYGSFWLVKQSNHRMIRHIWELTQSTQKEHIMETWNKVYASLESMLGLGRIEHLRTSLPKFIHNSVYIFTRTESGCNYMVIMDESTCNINEVVGMGSDIIGQAVIPKIHKSKIIWADDETISKYSLVKLKQTHEAELPGISRSYPTIYNEYLIMADFDINVSIYCVNTLKCIQVIQLAPPTTHLLISPVVLRGQLWLPLEFRDNSQKIFDMSNKGGPFPIKTGFVLHCSNISYTRFKTVKKIFAIFAFCFHCCRLIRRSIT